MKILDNLIDPEIERALAGLPNRVNELGFDDWGFSPTEARALFAVARRIHDYFHPSIQGIENLPPGHALVVTNHSGQMILVFPEGARGSGKVWKDRYRLQGFGRGFLRLALQTDTPIVPVGVVGGEESIISVHNWKGLARQSGTIIAQPRSGGAR